MRIALVTHFFAHYRRTVFELLLAHPRHRLTLVGDPDSSAHDGTIATWLPPDRSRMVATSFVRLPGGLLWQRGVVRLALSRRYDGLIFVADMKWLSSWVAAFLARALGKQVYYWAHGWRQRDHGLKGAVRRSYFSLANRLLLYGRRSRGIAIENGFDPRRVHVIYNCLDYPAQRAARACLGPAERRALRVSLFGDAEAPVVACPTRLVPQRRLDLLLEAVARLCAEHGRRVHVLLVGDGPERPALEALAARLGLAVHFAGACYDEERMAGYLTAATCTVAPGMVGLTAMHSLAFGVPVLTHGDPDRQNAGGRGGGARPDRRPLPQRRRRRPGGDDRALDAHHLPRPRGVGGVHPRHRALLQPRLPARADRRGAGRPAGARDRQRPHPGGRAG